MVKKTEVSVNAALYQECAGALFTPLSQQEMADALDCSVSAVKQALRDPDTPAFRKPPSGWEVTVRRLLLERADHFAELAQRLIPKE